jgi:hypothetical protein
VDRASRPRGRSLVGRAPPLHGGGRGFDSPRLHSCPELGRGAADPVEYVGAPLVGRRARGNAGACSSRTLVDRDKRSPDEAVRRPAGCAAGFCVPWAGAVLPQHSVIAPKQWHGPGVGRSE